MSYNGRSCPLTRSGNGTASGTGRCSSKQANWGCWAFRCPSGWAARGVDDFRYNAIVVDELQRAGAAAEAIAFSLQNDIVLPYLVELTTPEQQRRWLPSVVTGETVLGIAMTEPGTGSDLAGIRTTAV